MSLKNLSKSAIVLIISIILSVLVFLLFSLLPAAIIFLVILLPVIIFVLVKKWISKTFASLVFSFSLWLNIVVVLIPLMAGAAALDFAEFSKSLGSSDKVIAIKDKDIIFALEFKDLSSFESARAYSGQELLDLKNNIKSGNLNNVMVFVVDKEMFISVDAVNVNGLVLTMEEAFEFISSDNPRSLILRKFGNVPDNFNIDNAKSLVVLKLFEAVLSENSPSHIISSYKQGLIHIYPEYFSLKMIKYLPDAVLESALESFASSVIPLQTNKNNVNKQDIRSS